MVVCLCPHSRSDIGTERCNIWFKPCIRVIFLPPILPISVHTICGMLTGLKSVLVDDHNCRDELAPWRRVCVCGHPLGRHMVWRGTRRSRAYRQNNKRPTSTSAPKHRHTRAGSRQTPTEVSVTSFMLYSARPLCNNRVVSIFEWRKLCKFCASSQVFSPSLVFERCDNVTFSCRATGLASCEGD